MSNDTAKSPCINVCRLDQSGMCVGCGRLLDEIAGWPQMTDRQRCAVRAQAAQRLSDSDQPLPESAATRRVD